MITKVLTAALVFGSLTLGTGHASASPSPSDPAPNPFANLSCNCSTPDPAGRPASPGDLQRGLSTGLADRPGGTGESSR